MMKDKRIVNVILIMIWTILSSLSVIGAVLLDRYLGFEDGEHPAAGIAVVIFIIGMGVAVNNFISYNNKKGF